MAPQNAKSWALWILVAILVLGSTGRAQRRRARLGASISGRSTSREQVQGFRSGSFGVGDLPGYRPARRHGPLGSSIYGGGSHTIRRGSPGAAAGGGFAVRPGRSRRVYTPLAPVRISGGTGTAQARPVAPGSHLPYGRRHVVGSPIEDFAASLIRQSEKPSLPTEQITSLAPFSKGTYRDEMVKGEREFRHRQYRQAIVHFEKARILSSDSPESLLSLAHASFAIARDSYLRCSRYLVLTLKQFPDLPVLHIRLSRFYATPVDHRRDVDRLEQYAKDHPKDADAQFVLAYVKWGEGRFAAARTALFNARKHSNRETLTEAVGTFVAGMSVDQDTVAARAPVMGKPSSFPWAGIRLALPRGFQPRRLTEINGALTAIRGAEGTKNPQMISLWVYPADEGVALRSFMDDMSVQMMRNPAIHDVKIIEEEELDFLGREALARLITCRFHNVKVAALRLCFAREVQPSGADAPSRKVIYLLGTGLLLDQIDALLPTVGAVARTMSLTDFRRPVDLPLGSDEEGDRVKDLRYGYTIRQPEGWVGQWTATGFEMGQMDFSQGGIVTPNVKVIATSVPGSFTSKTFGEKAIKRKAGTGYEIEILSSRSVDLGGKAAYEFTVRTTPIAKDAAGQEASKAGAAARLTGSFVQVGRIICIPDKDSTQVRAVIVDCHGCEPKRARDVMDAIAAGFRLL